MSKLVRLSSNYWDFEGYGHWCPACKQGHEIPVGGINASGARWSFNGDPANPTFAPSVLIRWGDKVDPRCGVPGGVCHYFIRNGRIEYCGDCTHDLRGQTVDLPPIPTGVYTSCERL